MAEQLPLAVQLREAAELDHFIPGHSAEALAAVRLCANGEAPRRVVIHGPEGSGRTQLLLGAARAAQRAGRSTLYVSLAAADTPAMLESLHQAELLCIDDLDTPLVSREWSVAISRLLDVVDASDGGLLVATRVPPERLPFALPDLRTRLGRCASYGVRLLDDAGLRTLLHSRAKLRGLRLNDEAADYMIRRLPRDAGRLIEVLEKLDRASLSAQRRLTLSFVQAQLSA